MYLSRQVGAAPAATSVGWTASVYPTAPPMQASTATGASQTGDSRHRRCRDRVNLSCSGAGGAAGATAQAGDPAGAEVGCPAGAEVGCAVGAEAQVRGPAGAESPAGGSPVATPGSVTLLMAVTVHPGHR
ncbi:hypothetical protein KRMM14A1004_11850 [Krasilnikovia sp. MM14-A1004]